MNYGQLALSRVLQDQSLSPLMDLSISEEMFPDAESRQVFTFLMDFQRQHGTCPSPGLVVQQFPAYALPYAADPASFYLKGMVEQHVRTKVTEAFLREARRLPDASISPFEVLNTLRSETQKLALLGQRKTERRVTDNVADRWKTYEDRKNGVGIIGIPTPWATLDDLTQGWQPEMYFGVTARPGRGKTWWMLRVAHAAWAAGYKVLFVNKELPDAMMDRRWDSIDFLLPYEKLRSGMLSTADEARYEQGLKDLPTRQGVGEMRWLHGAMTISAIGAKIEEYKPDLVLVDGAYLLVDEEKGRQQWERQQNISRGLKRLTQEYKVPLGISIQLNRGGDTKKNKAPLTLSDVAGGDAYAQDVDLLIALEQDDDQKTMRILEQIPLKVREASPDPFEVGWDFETMESPDKGLTTQVLPGKSSTPKAGSDKLDYE